MSLKMNRSLITRKSWDSGAITPLSSVMHYFRKAGNYQMIVLAGSKQEPIGVFDLKIDESAPPKQVDIDLYALSQSGLASSLSAQTDFAAHPERPVLFFTSRGNESYAVLVNQIEADCTTAIFDSRALREGDIFLVSPLAGGDYVMTDGKKAKSEISINQRTGRSLPTDAVIIECTDAGLKPEKAEAKFMQPIVCMIKSKNPCRINFARVGGKESPEGRTLRRIKKRREDRKPK